MDILKPSEMRAKKRPDLAVLVAGYRQELAKLRLGISSGKLKTVAEVGKARRLIARALTVLREPEAAPTASAKVPVVKAVAEAVPVKAPRGVKKAGKTKITKERKRGKSASQ